ncbi:VOC family protein [Leucobacter soli]|uniref:VOC family protein n=1 Tax=Leucobacter soli TaxID=2812850 RepID=UPI00360FC3BF
MAARPRLGVEAGEALLRVGVSDVRGVEGRLAGWIPVFFVDDVDEAIARLRPGTWRLLDTGDGDGAYVADEQGSVVRLRERAAGRSGGSMNFDYSALDLAAAERFYTRLLDLEAAEVVDDTYAMRFLTSGRGIVAGVFQLSGIERLDRRPAWITYFEVDSVEELVNRAVQSGSRVRIPRSTRRSTATPCSTTRGATSTASARCSERSASAPSRCAVPRAPSRATTPRSCSATPRSAPWRGAADRPTLCASHSSGGEFVPR